MSSPRASSGDREPVRLRRKESAVPRPTRVPQRRPRPGLADDTGDVEISELILGNSTTSAVFLVAVLVLYLGTVLWSQYAGRSPLLGDQTTAKTFRSHPLRNSSFMFDHARNKPIRDERGRYIDKDGRKWHITPEFDPGNPDIEREKQMRGHWGALEVEDIHDAYGVDANPQDKTPPRDNVEQAKPVVHQHSRIIGAEKDSSIVSDKPPVVYDQTGENKDRNKLIKTVHEPRLFERLLTVIVFQRRQFGDVFGVAKHMFSRVKVMSASDGTINHILSKVETRFALILDNGLLPENLQRVEDALRVMIRSDTAVIGGRIRPTGVSAPARCRLNVTDARLTFSSASYGYVSGGLKVPGCRKCDIVGTAFLARMETLRELRPTGIYSLQIHDPQVRHIELFVSLKKSGAKVLQCHRGVFGVHSHVVREPVKHEWHFDIDAASFLHTLHGITHVENADGTVQWLGCAAQAPCGLSSHTPPCCDKAIGSMLRALAEELSARKLRYVVDIPSLADAVLRNTLTPAAGPVSVALALLDDPSHAMREEDLRGFATKHLLDVLYDRPMEFALSDRYGSTFLAEAPLHVERSIHTASSGSGHTPELRFGAIRLVVAKHTNAERRLLDPPTEIFVQGAGVTVSVPRYRRTYLQYQGIDVPENA